MQWFLLPALAALLVVVNGQGCTTFFASLPNHTMCIYKEKACPGFPLLRSGALSCAQKLEVVSAHNKLRQAIANGKVTGQPGAANMAEMVWDEELATVAQRWADQCSFGHDKQRGVQRFKCGQNVYMGSRSPVDPNMEPNMTTAVVAWYNEVNSPGFNAANIDPFVFSSGAGHYTQLAWADSYALGCGYVMWKDGTWSNKLIVCNYGPAGNFIGSSMYKKGTPNCPAYGRTASPRYPGLCVVPNTTPPGLTCTVTASVPPYVESSEEFEFIEQIF